MKTESHLSQADRAPQLVLPDTGPAQAATTPTAGDRRWRQFTTVSALLIEIPLALALIAAALLATLPGLAWD